MTSAVAPRSNTIPALPPSSSWPSSRGRILEIPAAETRETVFVYVSGLTGTGIEVIQPFVVRIDPDDEGFIAKSDISLVYEMGDTWQAALRSYLPALIEHFEWLAEIEQSLSPAVQAELDRLRQYLRLEK